MIASIPLQLTAWQIVALFLGTIACSAIAVIVPFYAISRSETFSHIMTKGDAVYLKYITVVVVIWSAAVLALLDHMQEGPSAIFGMVIGYVFGHVRTPTPATIPVEVPPTPRREG